MPRFAEQGIFLNADSVVRFGAPLVALAQPRAVLILPLSALPPVASAPLQAVLMPLLVLVLPREALLLPLSVLAGRKTDGFSKKLFLIAKINNRI